MSMFVDVVSEDSFYENLTLGVMKLLEANVCIENVQLERRAPCDRAVLSAWEQKHCCLLTEELRNFYISTDGFLLTWSLKIAGEEFPIGRMEIKDLANLKRYVGASTSSNSKEQQTDNCESSEDGKRRNLVPSFGDSRCKLFELAECGDCHVFLVYQLKLEQEEPSVWLYSPKLNQWFHLADNFCKYFRIMLVHLGLPLWQQSAVGLQLPTWVEQVYMLVGPHLLKSMRSSSAPDYSAESSLWSEAPYNIVDPAVFRNKDQQRHTGTKQKTNSSPTTTLPSTSGNSRKKSSSSSSHRV